MSAEDIFTERTREKPETQICPVTFKITSPLFYAQVVRHRSVLEYIKSALSNPDPKTATFHASDIDLLNKIFQRSPSLFSFPKMWPWCNAALADKNAALPHVSNLAWTSPANRLRWVPIFSFRLVPSPSHQSSLSDLDACALRLSSTDAAAGRAYRKAVFKILLSDYVAFGMPAVIDAALWIFRIWLCWLCVLSSDGLVGLCNGESSLSVTEVGKVLMGCLGVHLWWGLGELL